MAIEKRVQVALLDHSKIVLYEFFELTVQYCPPNA